MWFSGFDAVSTAVWPSLASMAGKSAILFALAAAAGWLLRRAPAARRHLVWSLAAAGSLLLPLLQSVLPKVALSQIAPVEGLAASDDAASTMNDSPGETLPVGAAPILLAQATVPATNDLVVDGLPAESPTQQTLNVPANWRGWLIALWLTGLVAALCPMAAGMASLVLLRRRSAPLHGGQELLLGRLVAEMGIRRRVTGLISDRRTVPMTWGWFRPVVLLPQAAESWSAQRLRFVLLHELAHIQRWDCLTQALGQVARAAYWFNPLAWWAVSRLRREQELACDDCVLRAGAPPADYAAELLNVTTGLSAWRAATAVALAMSRGARFEQRLKTILDVSVDRRPQTSRRFVATSAAALLATGVAAALGWSAVSAAPPAAASPAAAAPERPAQADDKAQAEGAKQAAAPQDQPADKETKDGQPDQTDLQSLAAIRELILKQYARPADSKALAEGAIRGMLDSLQDPYSSYLPAEALSQFSPTLVGVGVQLKLDGDRVLVTEVFPNSPGQKAGVAAKDVILQVDGKAVHDPMDAAKAIRGEAGTVVKLLVRHADGTEAELSATRGTIELPSMQGLYFNKAGQWEHWLDAEKKIAYVRLAQFSGRTAAQLKGLLERLAGNGLKGLVIDLRRCPGGMLSDAADTVKLFLNQGQIASIRNRDQIEQWSLAADGSAQWSDLPLVVVVDETTSSAGEVVAGALKDNGRARLVGTRTYGKGSIQSIIPLAEKGPALKLTTAFLHLPGGQPLARTKEGAPWGIDPPDGYFVPLTAEQRTRLHEIWQQGAALGEAPPDQPLTPAVLASKYSDPQLAAAVQTLTARLATGEFDKPGKSEAELQAYVARREDLRKKREEVARSLQELDRELGGP